MSSTRKPSHPPRCVACVTSCTNCITPILTTTDPDRPAQWLRDLRRQAIPTHTARWRTLAQSGFGASSPVGANVRVVYRVPKPNATRSTKPTAMQEILPKRVVYWAAQWAPLSDAHNLRGAERAYGDYRNMGVAIRTETPTHYVLTFDLMCPTPYLARARGARKARLWCRHLHYVPLVKTTVVGEVGCPKKKGDSVTRRKTQSNQKSRNSRPRLPLNPNCTWNVPPSTKHKLYTLPVFPSKNMSEYRERYSCTQLTPPHATQSSSSMFVTLSEYRHATHPNNGTRRAIGIVDSRTNVPMQSQDIVIDGSMSEKALGKVLREQVGADVRTPLVVFGEAGELLVKLTHLGWCNVWLLPLVE